MDGVQTGGCPLSVDVLWEEMELTAGLEESSEPPAVRV